MSKSVKAPQSIFCEKHGNVVKIVRDPILLRWECSLCKVESKNENSKHQNANRETSEEKFESDFSRS